MDRTQLIERIRKLQDRARRSNFPAEAAQAAGKAAELIARYAVRIDELDLEPEPAKVAKPRKAAARPKAAQEAATMPIRLEIRIGRARIRWKL